MKTKRKRQEDEQVEEQRKRHGQYQEQLFIEPQQQLFFHQQQQFQLFLQQQQQQFQKQLFNQQQLVVQQQQELVVQDQLQLFFKQLFFKQEQQELRQEKLFLQQEERLHQQEKLFLQQEERLHQQEKLFLQQEKQLQQQEKLCLQQEKQLHQQEKLLRQQEEQLFHQQRKTFDLKNSKSSPLESIRIKSFSQLYEKSRMLHFSKRVEIVKIEWKENKQIYVLKFANYNSKPEYEKLKKLFYCPYICHVLNHYQQIDQKGYIIRNAILMQFYEHKSLTIFIENTREHLKSLRLATTVIFKFIYEITLGLVVLHSEGFIHRKLSPENIFIGKDLAARIGDFSMISSLSTACERNVGISGYIAPEIIHQLDTSKPYNQSIDMFALGCILEYLIKKLELNDKKQEEENYAIDYYTNLYQMLTHPIPEVRPSAIIFINELSRINYWNLPLTDFYMRSMEQILVETLCNSFIEKNLCKLILTYHELLVRKDVRKWSIFDVEIWSESQIEFQIKNFAGLNGQQFLDLTDEDLKKFDLNEKSYVEVNKLKSFFEFNQYFVMDYESLCQKVPIQNCPPLFV